MLMSWLGRLHGAFLLWGLLFLGASIVGAAGAGFSPDRERYLDPEFTFPNNGRPRLILSLFPEPNGQKVVILDSAEGEAFRGVDREILGRMVKILETRGLQVVRSSGADALPLARDADLVVLATDLPAYREIDFAALADAMRGIYLYDYSGYWSDRHAESDHAELAMVNFTRQYWPHWLDLDLEIYVDHVKERVPVGEGILMLPGRFLNNSVTRSRWFLPLNQKLADRRLYLWNPQLGTSFVTEYFEWVEAYREKNPWQHTRPVRLPKREHSNLVDFSPTRTLTAEEIEAAHTHDVQWILFWSHQPDFRLADWELVPLETAIQWTEEAGS